MASSGKKRKQTAIEKKSKRPESASPPSARDGDRRRRMGPVVREALARKREVNEWTIDDGPPLDVLTDGDT